MSGETSTSGSSDSDGIRSLEDGIRALLSGAQTLAAAVTEGKSDRLLLLMAVELRPLFEQTMKIGIPQRDALPKGTLPAISQASQYLEDSISAIEKQLPQWKIEIQSQAMVATLEGLL